MYLLGESVRWIASACFGLRCFFGVFQRFCRIFSVILRGLFGAFSFVLLMESSAIVIRPNHCAGKNFKPMMPAKINAMQPSRSKVVSSSKTKMPINVTPMAPIPVQIA